jgi:hypothetical protein
VSDELEQLAAKKRVASGKSTWAERRARADAARRRGGGDDAMIRRAFAPAWYSSGSAAVGAMLFGASVTYYVLEHAAEPLGLDLDVLAGIFVALTFALVMLVLREVGAASRRAQHAWLERLPFPFDVARYLGLLRRKHGMVRIVVQVTPATELSESDARLVADAVDGALKKVLVRWRRDGVLEIKSPPINTTEMVLSDESVGRTDSQTFPDNSGCHRWVRRCVDRALSPVHARFPIASVAIDFV